MKKYLIEAFKNVNFFSGFVIGFTTMWIIPRTMFD